ncbi:MAG: DUF481 domain-containing protein [Proteobacteria bacterium]|nr:DUF481 domain-containing protein [Pseudomonadota bacterium]MBU4294437.1 DUF481 domain-containing protein [Pseudomonadota bacterium]MCG2747619.1 DUF481 domain-containing protein [Desulfobulbaceae bacterium]
MPFFCRISAVLLFIFLSPSVALAEIVILKNGDTLSGKIVAVTGEAVTLEHEVLGVLTLPKSQIKSDEDKITLQQPAKKTTPGVFGTNFLEGWNRRVALGVKGEEGNDVSLNLNGALDASYEDKDNRLALSAAYFYESQDHERNTSKGNGSFVRDWLFSDSPWFYYSYSRYDYDEFKSWEQRVSLIGGTGYSFFDEEKFKLLGRIGLGGNRTWGEEDDFNPEAQLGFECHWLANSVHSVSAKFFIFPDLNERGEYRTQTQAKWEINLSIARGLGLELGIEHEYESKLYDGLDKEKHYDLLYFGRIGLDL